VDGNVLCVLFETKRDYFKGSNKLAGRETGASPVSSEASCLMRATALALDAAAAFTSTPSHIINASASSKKVFVPICFSFFELPYFIAHFVTQPFSTPCLLQLLLQLEQQIHIHSLPIAFLYFSIHTLIGSFKRFITRHRNNTVLIELARCVEQRQHHVREVVATLNVAESGLETASAGVVDTAAVSSASLTDISRATAHEIISSLLSTITSDQLPVAPIDPSSTTSCFSADPMPPPPLSLPVVKIPEDGFDRYHESAPQFARECLRELTERGALVLNCGMDAEWSSCLHLSSEALARCVLSVFFVSAHASWCAFIAATLFH
jgi:hypothetical protein